MEENKEVLKIGEANLKAGARIFQAQKDNLEELGKLRDEIKTDEVKKLLDKIIMEIFKSLIELEKVNKEMEKQLEISKKIIL